jgi:hypothetical protein
MDTLSFFVLSQSKCRIFPRATDKMCDVEASVVRPQHVKHLGIVPHLQAVGQIQACVLPFQGMPVTWRRRLLGLQLIERRPVVDGPGRLLQGNPSYAVSLDLKAAMLTNQRKKMVADGKRAVIVGCYEFQRHVIVTTVHVPTVSQGSSHHILERFPWK